MKNTRNIKTRPKLSCPTCGFNAVVQTETNKTKAGQAASVAAVSTGIFHEQAFKFFSMMGVKFPACLEEILQEIKTKSRIGK
jgi:hypothetical protein